MRFFKTLESINLNKKTIILIGNFDGFHKGHQKLLEFAFKKNKNKEKFILVFTFNPYFKKEKYLTTFEEKKFLIKNFGINGIINIPMNNIIFSLDKEVFLKNILIKKLNIDTIIVGHDFHFGYNAIGDINYLKKESKKLKYKIKVVNSYKINKEIVSSTKIRAFIKQGNIEKANKFMGHNFIIEGKIICGKGIGKKIGFPTINIKIKKNKLLPKIGVYAIKSIIDKKTVFGMCNIGYNPTFENKKQLKMEIHIFDFNKNIYGLKIFFEILFFIRNEINFKNKENLIQQLYKDKNKILCHLKSYLVN